MNSIASKFRLESLSVGTDANTAPGSFGVLTEISCMGWTKFADFAFL